MNVGSDIGEENLQIKKEVQGLFRKEQEPYDIKRCKIRTRNRSRSSSQGATSRCKSRGRSRSQQIARGMREEKIGERRYLADH